MELSTRTRRALSTVLALVLAVESVSVVAAAATTRPVTHALPAEPPAGVVLAAEAPAIHAAPAVVVPVAAAVAVVPDQPEDPRPSIAQAPAAASAAKDGKGKADQRSKRGDAKPSRDVDPKPARPAPKPDPGPRVFRGSNHVWIPSLGISRSVRWFPCDRQRPPDNYMYRWGCAGANNVYLMGHAYGVMAPLHNAYVNGRLRKGMKAYYADGSGRVHAYAVKWWKVTLPTTDAAWAWAAQSTPSMTLQTCVGKNSKYRLMVRLVQVKG